MNLLSLTRVMLASAFLLSCGILRAHAATFTVSSLNDSGADSLRQALANANAAPDADTITFASSLRGTLTLTSESLTINSNMSIIGPGANTLALSGNGSQRLLNITKGTVALSGLTLTKGYVRGQTGEKGTPGYVDIWGERGTPGGPGGEGESAGGGAISNAGVLTLTDVSFLNNTVIGGTGGEGGSGMVRPFIGAAPAGPGRGRMGSGRGHH